MAHELLNRLAPDFSLPILGGGRFNLSDLRGNIVVLNFWSAACVWSRRADVLLVYRQLTWSRRGVRIVGLACNYSETDVEIGFEAEKRHLQYSLLLDREQKIASLYKAATTPHFFILDRQRIIRYIGALDDATKQRRQPTQMYVDRAVAALLADEQPDPAQTKPYGCTIARLSAEASGRSIEKQDN